MPLCSPPQLKAQLSPRPLPFIAPGMKAAFGRGDLRAEARQILSFQRSKRRSRGQEGTLGTGSALPTRVPSPSCPVRVCKTILSIFRLLWHTAAAPSS